MRPEKDREWELPFGNPGEMSVLMDIRDELKQLNRQLALLAIELEGRKEVELPPLPVTDGAPPVIATSGTGRGTTSTDIAHPPPAPTPPPPAHKPPVHTVRRKR